jgi:D-alanyl-D-alanine carboxypeptidase/D-alanyl-D-alanine-endopeptidase (penicillin-binding protein 4)
VGRPPGVSLEPGATWLEIENRARTVADGKNSVWLTRDPESNRFTMFGEVRFPTKVPVEITVHEPALLAGQLLAAELPHAGVAVGKVPALAEGRKLSREDELAAVASARLAQPGEPGGGRTLAAVTTHIRDVLERCNNDSQNLYAESMIKRVGHEVTGEPGSWTNGSSVVRMTIAQHLGAEFAATTVVSDGSGMSREDKVAPRTLARWLDLLQKNPKFGEEFVESMATPGEGTLHRRFGDIKLHSVLRAKSGKLDGVRCLSGYLTDKQTGHRVAFSVMVNNLKEGEQALQALQFHEDVVALADHWLVTQRAPEQRPARGGAANAEPTQTRIQRR